ncbi:MAG: hypothetical protein HOJ57_16925, partial [Lentisphaerae bacterium]|nr:hypothetical protein [Lentisphaerota bacterium]
MTRRLGRSVLRIEAKAPGLPRMLTGRYSDDVVCSFVRTIHPDDATKAAGFLGKADGPATRALLLKRYRETEGKVLKWLDWKTVMAFGLTAAVVTSAHEVSDGVQEGLKTVSQTSPETFGQTLTDLVAPVTGPLGWLGLGAVICLILAITLGLHLPSRVIHEVRRVRAGEPKEETSERQTHQDGAPSDQADPPAEL